MPNKDRSGVGNREGTSKQVKKRKVIKDKKVKKVNKVKKKHVRNDSGEGQRSTPIITMLEEIRLYIMQRLFAMNKIAVNLEDNITPSIRYLFVFPCGFQELEVRNRDESFGVNLHHKGHNKSFCKNETRPKPGMKKPPGRKRQHVTGENASRGGLGSRGGRGRGGRNNSRGRGNSSRERPSSGVGKTKLCKAVNDTTEQGKSGSKKRNTQKWQQQAYVDGMRIYVKNHRRSKRIENQKHKFNPMGTGSTPITALSVSDSN
nr:hypothetical protein [Tanacetum cinerariifolium]